MEKSEFEAKRKLKISALQVTALLQVNNRIILRNLFKRFSVNPIHTTQECTVFVAALLMLL